MDRFKALLIDVGVNLGGGDSGVAKEFLDDTEIGTVFKEVGGKGVPQQVRVDVLFNPGLLGAFFDDLADAVR